MAVSPFQICRDRTALSAQPERFNQTFAAGQALSFADAFEPEFLNHLMVEAAGARFVDNVVERVGSRRVESPQRVGLAISLALHRLNFFDWLEKATGARPLRAVAGRLVETTANGRDALDWHDDNVGSSSRRLAVVIDLSQHSYCGGQFQLRIKGQEHPFFDFSHPKPGSLLIFAVGPKLEHRVTSLTSGGPRRVFAGWLLSGPEFEHGSLGGGAKPINRS